MDKQTLIITAFVVVAVIATVARQFLARPLAQGYRRPIVMIIVGVFLVGSQVVAGATLTTLDVVSLALGLTLAAVVAWPLARSRRIFVRDGRLMSRGTWVTAALWVGFLALRLAETTFLPVLFGRGLHAMTPLAGYASLLVVSVLYALQTWFTLRRPEVTEAPAAERTLTREKVTVR